MNPAHAHTYGMTGVSASTSNENSGGIVAQPQDTIYPVVNIFGMRFFSSFAEDLNLPSEIKVSIIDHDCHDPVEKFYYSCGYEPVCIY